MAKTLLIGITLLLCCYSAAEAQTIDCNTIPANVEIVEVGAFSNMRYTEEHAYGYTVMLWHAEKCLFGFFESSEGLAGDTPIGELQGVKYDPSTGALSFSAKLTTGLVGLAGSNGMETSRDLFTFDGYLRPTRLTGVITYENQNNQNIKAIRNKVVLRASKEEGQLMHGPRTYGEWRETWQPVLQFRGPKW